jgi:hypothetical protein
MKHIFKKLIMPSLLTALFTTGCSDFDEINTDPYMANESQVQVEYLINNSIYGAQQDPHIAERIFVLYWKTAGRQAFGGGISVGTYDDGWSSDYYGSSYMGGWLNHVYAAVQLAEKQIADGNAKAYTNNQLQVARIWRAYLLSELTDNFGPIPLDGYMGKNPTFSDVKTVYYFLLDELKDASAKIDPSVSGSLKAELDKAYGYDYAKWQRYANSMRLRLAMRLSEVDPAKAKSEFEAAVGAPLITTLAETFQIQEEGGWAPLTGVMTREWNHFLLSASMNNLFLGLGGVKSQDQLDASYASYIKPSNYVGLKFENHFSSMTNDPSAGYWMDGLPNTIDPRAYKAYIIPGDFSNPDFNSYPSWDATARTTERELVDDAGATVKSIDAKFTWNASANGAWGAKGTKNRLYSFQGTIPRHGQQFRNGTSQRIFFGPWETYFLIAEAAVRGWNVPMSGKVAYETGITRNFEYWDGKSRTGAKPSTFLANYLASSDYNRVGTSVSWDHTTEPAASYAITYKNGYTGADASGTRVYPKNDLYKNGTVKNDLLTKIITQKFIAQSPWLPLETWSDHRRLGLPFFENPVVELPMANLPSLNSGNYLTSNVKFFPQRLKYPSSLSASNAEGYAQGVAGLGGPDEVLTSLWWAKK